jgi:UDP-hydrolysing UDP-N-acetyl-D-glucosamine 2-epimerase
MKAPESTVPKRIVVLTTGRQDWGILRSTCHALKNHCALRVFAGGMAVTEEHGNVASQIAKEHFDVTPLPWPLTPQAPPEELSAAASHLGKALAAFDPDSLVLLGDRSETAAAALVATLLRIPIAHLHGGEETEGAFDNALRHAVTKLAHLHFVSHAQHAARVSQMGEAEETIEVVGAPGLDNFHRPDLPDREELEVALGLDLSRPVVLVTVHPTTLSDVPEAEAIAVAEAMDRVSATYVITLPNADPGSDKVRGIMQGAGARRGRVSVAALGERNYWGMLRIADAILGNSSSALIEAPAVGLPAVNVGDRQKGRLRSGNVVDVSASVDEIANALKDALTTERRQEVRKLVGPNHDGNSGKRIANRLLSWSPPRPLRKRFIDR